MSRHIGAKKEKENLTKFDRERGRGVRKRRGAQIGLLRQMKDSGSSLEREVVGAVEFFLETCANIWPDSGSSVSSGGSCDGNVGRAAHHRAIRIHRRRRRSPSKHNALEKIDAGGDSYPEPDQEGRRRPPDTAWPLQEIPGPMIRWSLSPGCIEPRQRQAEIRIADEV